MKFKLQEESYLVEQFHQIPQYLAEHQIQKKT